MTADHARGLARQPLLLVPTAGEREALITHLPAGTTLHECGFGPLVAGVETARMLAEKGRRQVVLIGIAGTYDRQQLPVGTACSFHGVANWGIGAGEGADFQTAAELGFGDGGPAAVLPLQAAEPSRQLILTVTRAAASADQVMLRRRQFPEALAEDMEAWPVAWACSRFDCPLTVIRGISNVAGQRDHSRWQVHAALQAAAGMLARMLAGTTSD
jgi:futalosine hydrolase